MRVCALVVLVMVVSCGHIQAAEDAKVETLLEIPPGEKNGRNTEGDIERLKDGRLCLIYSRFHGDDFSDFASADLAMRSSNDDGKTWTDDSILVSGEEGDMKQVMSVSILRLGSGELLLFYLRLNSRSSDHLYVRRSPDEFKTLSEPTRVGALEGYEVVNNDRIIQLSTGRLIVPANMHSEYDEQGNASEYQGLGVPFVYYSDDEGHTWKKDNTRIKPNSEREPAVQENGVIELADGRLWMWMRTWSDYQYGCYSSDGGITWSDPEPTALASPGSPATIKRIPWTGDLLCVWNDHSGDHPYPKPYPKEKHRNKRTPLCAAISRDEGKTWDKSRVIEGLMTGWFCYISMTFDGDRVILSYMQRDESVTTQLGLKVVALPKEWLYPGVTEQGYK